MAFRILNGWYDRNNNDITLIYINELSPIKKLVRILKNRYPYIYVKRNNLKYVQALSEVREANIDPLSPEFVKVYLNKVQDVYSIRDHLKEVGIEPYEADIPFVRRVMIDEDIKVGNMPLRKLFYDIETDDRQFGFELGRDRIVSIAAMDLEGNSYYFSNESEKKILQDFLKCANDYHSLIGWNSSRFDYPVMKDRCRKNNIYVNWMEWQKLDFLPIYKFSHQQKKSSYALDAVGEDECNLRKIERTEKIWWLFKNNPDKLKEYNLRDVEIMVRLEQKTHLVTLQERLASFADLFVEHVTATSILDSLVLRKVQRERLPYRYPCKGEYVKGEKFEGGLVLEPVTGIHSNVIVIDFKSLYDRIAQSLNLSPETLLKEEEEGCIKSPIGTYFNKNKQGILPQLMLQFSEIDAYWKKKILEAKTKEEQFEAKMNRLPVKFTLKAFYGQMGTPYCRYYTPEIAATITGTARWLLNRSVDIVRKEFGYLVIGSDTDSLFISVGDNPIEKGNKLVERLNELYSIWLKDEINSYDNRILMKFEKVFDKAIFVAKKRYVAHLIWEEGYDKDELKFTGIEYVRSEWCQYAKDLQLNVIKMLLNDESTYEISKIIREKQKEVIDRKLTKKDLIISQSITRNPEEYTTDLPHVRIAKKLDHVWVGVKIRYIITDTGEVHMDDYKEGEYDPEFYWNKKIYPPTFRILMVSKPDTNWEDFLIKRKFKITKDQTFLDSYI